MDELLYATKFLAYTAGLQLFGLAVFQAWLAPDDLHRRLTRLTRSIALASAVVLLASVVVWLLLTAAIMGSGWGDAINPTIIGRVLGATRFGAVWSFELGFAVLCVLAAFFLRGPQNWKMLAIISTLALGAMGLVGHAASGTGIAGAMHRTSNVLHLLSSGFWLGSLLPLVVTLGHLRDPVLSADADVALRRFSGLGHYAVAIALASGVINTWFILRDVDIDFAISYQAILAAKIVLVGFLITLALVNRYVFVPRIPNNGPGLVQLRNGTIAEIVVSAGILGLVSVLGSISPHGVH